MVVEEAGTRNDQTRQSEPVQQRNGRGPYDLKRMLRAIRSWSGETGSLAKSAPNPTVPPSNLSYADGARINHSPRYGERNSEISESRSETSGPRSSVGPLPVSTFIQESKTIAPDRAAKWSQIAPCSISTGVTHSRRTFSRRVKCSIDS